MFHSVASGSEIGASSCSWEASELPRDLGGVAAGGSWLGQEHEQERLQEDEQKRPRLDDGRHRILVASKDPIEAPIE